MALAHEDDVVIAFRQAVEEELRRVEEGATADPVLVESDSLEQNMTRLAESHERLQTEVALLRTVILKLLSQPIDTQNQA